MRAIRNLHDAEVVLRQHGDFIDAFQSRDIDARLHRIHNLGPATDPDDAVTLTQLKNAIGSGFTGSFNYIKTVDFAGSKVTFGTIIVTNGKITGVK